MNGAAWPEERQRLLAACAVFLGLLFWFLGAAYPGLAPGDSAETAAMCLTLGIGHPSGYPLLALAGRAFSLLPLGHGAIQINFFAATLTALCGALAFSWAWAWSQRDGRHGFLAATVVLGLLLASPLFWDQAVAAKGSLYSLNLALSLGILLCLLKPSDPRRLRLAALLFGAALAGHVLIQLLLLPGYLILMMVPGKGSERPTLRALGSATGWMLPGLSAWAYLPLRSHFDPWLNWSDISSLQEAWDHVARSQYVPLEVVAGHAQFLPRLSSTLGGIFAAWGWGLGAAVLGGLIIGLRQRNAVPFALLTLALVLPVVGVYHLGPQVDPQFLRIYALPSMLAGLMLVVPIGWGLPTATLRQTGLVWVLLAVVVGPLNAPRAVERGRAEHFELEDHIRDLRRVLPSHSLLVAPDDATIFGLWYAQSEGHRRDVAVLPAMMAPARWVRKQIGLRQPWVAQAQVGAVGADSLAPVLKGLLDLNLGRLPVFSSEDSVPTLGTLGFRYAPWGSLWAMLPPGPVPHLKHPERLRGLLAVTGGRSVGRPGDPADPSDAYRQAARAQTRALLQASARP